MALTITLRDNEHLPLSTIEVNDSDEFLLIEALNALRERKLDALEAILAEGIHYFTKADMGIPRIDALLVALHAGLRSSTFQD